MASINKDYDQVIENNPKNINSDGSIMVNLESEFNIFDPGDKLTNRPKHSLKQIIEFINKKQKWKLVEIKNVADDLWQYYIFYFRFYANNPQKKKEVLDIINHYIKYLDHQSKYLDFFSNNILTLVATIFLPLTFITGFFGMNFESMGVPSLKKGVFTIKNADFWIGIFSLVIIVIMGFQFNQVYHIFFN
jgi:hypothetical protein